MEHMNELNGFKVGDKVLVHSDSNLGDFTDTIRALFMQHALCEPYARNYFYPAAVLTDHSWASLDKMVRL